MSVVISRPSGVNVGVMNPGDTIYVKGDATTANSLRFHAHVKADGLMAIFAEEMRDGADFLVDLQAQEGLSDAGGDVIVDDNSGDIVTSIPQTPLNPP